MNKMTSKRYAVGLARQPQEESRLNELDFIEPSPQNLLLCNSYYESLDDFDKIEDLAEGDMFWYSIEQFDDEVFEKRQTIGAERGIGYIKKERGHNILVRHKCFYVFGAGMKTPRATEHHRTFDKDRNLFVFTRIPEFLSENMMFENSVLCADEEFCPKVVQIQENSLLGRRKGKIESLTGPEISETLGNKFELTGNNSIIISNTLFLKSQKSRPRGAKAGQIIYNSRKKCFEGYDGTKWRSFKWE